MPVLDDDGRVVRIEEKPEVPASNFGVTGIYCYDADVFDVIPTLVPSGRGELEITDVNNHYVSQGQMAYDVLEGFWGDAGESIEAYYAVNDFVRANGANRTKDRQRLGLLVGRPEQQRLAHALGDAGTVEPEAGQDVVGLPLGDVLARDPEDPGHGARAPLRCQRWRSWRRPGRPRRRRGGRRPRP